MKIRVLSTLTLALLLAAPMAATLADQSDPAGQADPYLEQQQTPPADPQPADTPEANSQKADEPQNEAPAADEATSDEELPKTAGPLALLALIGLGSAGSAAGLRLARRK